MSHPTLDEASGMDQPSSFHDLMLDLLSGDEEAAQRVVEDHSAGLIALARRQIGSRLARRIDPEDVVQSVYRSFFLRVRDGQYSLGSGQDLWKLLVTITLNKVRRQSNYHHASKRCIAHEQPATSNESGLTLEKTAISTEPPVEYAMMLIDELEALVSKVRPCDRQIVALRLQGHTSVEIADETGRAERTVRRVLERFQQRLGQAAV